MPGQLDFVRSEIVRRRVGIPVHEIRNRSLSLQSTLTLVLAKPSSSQSNSVVDALNFCSPIPILRDIFRINGFDDQVRRLLITEGVSMNRDPPQQSQKV